MVSLGFLPFFLGNISVNLYCIISRWRTIKKTFILKHENLLSRQCLLIQEKEELSTTNKVHNFTSINLPSDLNELLDKGTNFIPTLDKIKIQPCAKLSTKEPTPTSHTPKRKPTSDTSLTSRRKQSSDFKNNNLNLILIYKLLIMFSTQRYTQNSSYNPIT